jgi:two-component system nitrate/nitrite response regulator NarL
VKEVTAVIVDDSPVETAFVSRIITELGVKIVHVANDGQSGLDAIRKLKPSMALLDIVLPQLEGSQILAAVIAEKLPTTVIMCTSNYMRKKQLLAKGARCFLTKPYDDLISQNELRPIVEELRAAL